MSECSHFVRVSEKTDVGLCCAIMNAGLENHHEKVAWALKMSAQRGEEPEAGQTPPTCQAKRVDAKPLPGDEHGPNKLR